MKTINVILISANYANGTFDVIVSKDVNQSPELLALLLKLLKPGGNVRVSSSLLAEEELKMSLILSGFVKIITDDGKL